MSRSSLAALGLGSVCRAANGSGADTCGVGFVAKTEAAEYAADGPRRQIACACGFAFKLLADALRTVMPVPPIQTSGVRQVSRFQFFSFHRICFPHFSSGSVDLFLAVPGSDSVCKSEASSCGAEDSGFVAKAEPTEYASGG